MHYINQTNQNNNPGYPCESKGIKAMAHAFIPFFVSVEKTDQTFKYWGLPSPGFHDIFNSFL
jgi:hypothetical protein